jgi:hypothetical protein
MHRDTFTLMCTWSRLLHTSWQWEVFFRVFFRSGWIYVLFQRWRGSHTCVGRVSKDTIPNDRQSTINAVKGLGGREGASVGGGNPLVRSPVCHSTHLHATCDTDRFGPSVLGVQAFSEARVLPADQTFGTQGYIWPARLVQDHHRVLDARFGKGWWGDAGPEARTRVRS